MTVLLLQCAFYTTVQKEADIDLKSTNSQAQQGSGLLRNSGNKSTVKKMQNKRSKRLQE